MIERIQSIILEFQHKRLETGVPRRLKIESLPGKAAVCIGVRRAGKSTLMFQIVSHLLAEGVAIENILYLNFFDDRLYGLGKENLGLITEAYFSLYPEKKNSEKIYCFFDEVQMVPAWEPFIDRLLRTENCEVYLSGSSSRMLSKEIATQMRGRALSWELFPFSFQEFLDSRRIDSSVPRAPKAVLLIRKAFEEYWDRGGFPEVMDLNRDLRIRVHQEYFHAILYRDLVERHDVSHPKAVLDLAHRLIDNSASLYSVNSLTGYLKSLGHKVPKSSVSEYMDYLEDAYLLFTVRIFDASLARRNTNPKKIYCIDHALTRSVSAGVLVNSGHLLENLVFIALRRRFPEIYYYRTRTGREVDFVIPSGGRPRFLVQVCEALQDEKTRSREIGGLRQAMRETGLERGFIVTRNEREEIVVEEGKLRVLPAWRFCLDFPHSGDEDSDQQ